MLTKDDLNIIIDRQYEKYIKEHPDMAGPDIKWAVKFGILANYARHRINEAASITLAETDTISIDGYTLKVYEGGLASRVKASITMDSFQHRALLRQIVEDWWGGDIEDWQAVNLTSLVED